LNGQVWTRGWNVESQTDCSPSVLFVVGIVLTCCHALGSSLCCSCSVSVKSFPGLEALVKRQIQLHDDEDDNIVNNNTKKAKPAHIADDDDHDVDPLKPATQDIEDILVDADAEENEQNEENGFQDLSQHSSQELLQAQNADNEDGNDDDDVN